MPFEIGSDIISLSLKMVILDESFNDRLNPESISYFGEEYVNGMKFFYFDNEVKGHQDTRLSSVATGIILPPFIWSENGENYVNQGSRGYYFFSVSTMSHISFPDGTKGSYFYILYPDGSKDEVKTEIWEKPSVMSIGKVWFNEELAYENNHGPNALNGVYYNPKFFPFMKPTFDDKGNQIGEFPDYGERLFLTVIK